MTIPSKTKLIVVGSLLLVGASLLLGITDYVTVRGIGVGIIAIGIYAGVAL